MVDGKRPVQLNLRISERTDRQINELQRQLSRKIGTQFTKTMAVETAVDRLLRSLMENPEQLKFVDI